jgi:hypothetical protein
MVTVVLLTTLITPLIMRGAFMIRCAEDEDQDGNQGASDPAGVMEMRAEALGATNRFEVLG